MKTSLLVLTGILFMSSSFADSATRLNCTGKIRQGEKMVMTVEMNSDHELKTMRSFMLNKNQKPVFMAGISKQVGVPGVKSPETTLTFKYEDEYMDKATLYVSNQLSSFKGKTTTAVLVIETDGLDPAVADFTCNVR